MQGEDKKGCCITPMWQLFLCTALCRGRMLLRRRREELYRSIILPERDSLFFGASWGGDVMQQEDFVECLKGIGEKTAKTFAKL